MNYNKKLLSEEAVSEIRSRIPNMAKDIHEGIVSDAIDLARGIGSVVSAGARAHANALWQGTRTGARAVGQFAKDAGRVVGKEIIWNGIKQGAAEHVASTIANTHREMNMHQHEVERGWSKALGMKHQDLRHILDNAPETSPVVPNFANLPAGVSAKDLKQEYERDRNLWNAKIDLSHKIVGIHVADPDLRRRANYVNNTRRALNRQTNIPHEEPWWATPHLIPQKVP